MGALPSCCVRGSRKKPLNYIPVYHDFSEKEILEQMATLHLRRNLPKPIVFDYDEDGNIVAARNLFKVLPRSFCSFADSSFQYALGGKVEASRKRQVSFCSHGLHFTNFHGLPIWLDHFQCNTIVPITKVSREGLSWSTSDGKGVCQGMELDGVMLDAWSGIDESERGKLRVIEDRRATCGLLGNIATPPPMFYDTLERSIVSQKIDIVMLLAHTAPKDRYTLFPWLVQYVSKHRIPRKHLRRLLSSKLSPVFVDAMLHHPPAFQATYYAIPKAMLDRLRELMRNDEPMYYKLCLSGLPTLKKEHRMRVTQEWPSRKLHELALRGENLLPLLPGKAQNDKQLVRTLVQFNVDALEHVTHPTMDLLHDAVEWYGASVVAAKLRKQKKNRRINRLLRKGLFD